MKKLFLSLVVAMMAATATFAQSSMLATLSHEGEISTFYGASALREAHTAAADGDVITLSSGSFNAVDITKAVTIRGAGMAVDNSAQTEPTIITGDFTIKIADNTTSRLTLEGIYSNHKITIYNNLTNATFIKCRFYTITVPSLASDVGVTKNLTMIHCKNVNTLYLGSNGSSASFVNSYVCLSNGALKYLTAEYVNCIVSAQYFEDGEKSSFKNCMFVQEFKDNNYLGSKAVAYNCVVLGNHPSFFNEIPNTTNSVVANYTDLFKSYTGTYNDDESFELTETAKTTYKGIDGTEIGIYGGNMPFSTTPTNPQITKCNVAAKSTADGKLSVDITVNGAE